MGPFGGWPWGPAAHIALRAPGCPSPSQKPPASGHPHPRPWGQAPGLLLGRCRHNVVAVFEKVMVGKWHVTQ